MLMGGYINKGNVYLSLTNSNKTAVAKLFAILINGDCTSPFCMGVCPLFLSGRSSRVGAWANWNRLTGRRSNQTAAGKSSPARQPIMERCRRNPSPNFTRRHRLKTKPRWNLPVWTGFNRLRVSCLREERRRRHTTSIPPRWKSIRVTN